MIETGSADGQAHRPILVADQVRKRFGGIQALTGADLTIREGTLTGLIGPNGAGKTTLFNAITGFVEPDGGRINMDGTDITGFRPDQIFHQGLCRTFQIPREHPSMSVLENLMLVPADQLGEKLGRNLFFPSRLRSQEARIRERAMEMMKFVDLQHMKDEYARNLSGGQKKLLELARTLMVWPKVVLLDEPGAGVNPSLMQRLQDTIEYLNREHGITFLVIEHDMDLIMRMCDPVVVMSEGRRLIEGPPSVVQNDPKVLEAYLGGQYATAES